MTESYVTQNEIDAMNASDLKRDTPFLIFGVSQTQFSIARHYGAVSFNGAGYTYIPGSDELIRDDVLKWLMRRRKPVKKAQKNKEMSNG